MQNRLRELDARRHLYDALIGVYCQREELDEMYVAVAARAQTDHHLAFLSEFGRGDTGMFA